MWWLRGLGGWLPGGKRPLLLGGGRSRWDKRYRQGRGPFDFGKGKNAFIRLCIYGVAAFYIFLLLVVKLVTGQ